MSSLIQWPQTNPYIGFGSYTLKLSRKTAIMRSPFTGTRQALVSPYALWVFSGKFSKQQLLNAAALRSFLVQLDGQANKFKLPIPDANSPLSGYIGNTGLVNGANQTGSSLTTDGWDISTLIFADGDYFTVNDELKQVVGYVVSDGSGNATINFKPSIRYSPADNLQLFIGNQVNMLTYSNNMSDASYFKFNSTITNGFFDPNGGTTAHRLVRTATGNCYISKQVTRPIVYNVPYTFSIWLKLGTLTGNVAIFLCDAVGGNVTSAIVTPLAGWNRFSVTAMLPPGAPLPMQMEINPVNMAGSAGDYLFIYGDQVEKGSAPTAYKETTTGDGQPYVLMSASTDDAASWDLTPPIVYDIQFDAIESYE